MSDCGTIRRDDHYWHAPEDAVDANPFHKLDAIDFWHVDVGDYQIRRVADRRYIASLAIRGHGHVVTAQAQQFAQQVARVQVILDYKYLSRGCLPRGPNRIARLKSFVPHSRL